MVDETARRELLADAVWTLVREGGPGQASVRRVAGAAGLAVGSVRHYFPTHGDLHAYAMARVTRRVRARVDALDPPDDPVARAEWILEEFLPLDEERRIEADVWQAFVVAGRGVTALAAVREAGDGYRRAVCGTIAADLMTLNPELDPRHEADRLNVLLAGLATIDAGTDPLVAAAYIRDLLGWHVDTMLTNRR